MISTSCSGSGSTRLGVVFTVMSLAATGLFLSGCDRSQRHSLEVQLKEMNLTQQTTARFAGTVTIDGKPPRDAINQGLLIMVYNPEKPPPDKAAPLKTIVNRETGRFAFTTYSQGDGVPLGSYVLLFVALKHSLLGKSQGYHEPDALKNLYDDPDKNAQNSDFKVTIGSSGLTDYSVDLKLEGQDPVTNPGPHAVTHFEM